MATSENRDWFNETRGLSYTDFPRDTAENHKKSKRPKAVKTETPVDG